MTIPFALVDLLEVLGISPSAGHGVLVLNLCVVSGGLLAGVWQARILKSHASGPNLWILLSLAAWFLAELTTLGIMKPGHPETFLEIVQNLGAIPIGGFVQGLVSGGSLARLLRPEVSPA